MPGVADRVSRDKIAAAVDHVPRGIELEFNNGAGHVKVRHFRQTATEMIHELRTSTAIAVVGEDRGCVIVMELILSGPIGADLVIEGPGGIARHGRPIPDRHISVCTVQTKPGGSRSS